MDPVVSTLGGVTRAAILLVLVLSTVIACTEVRVRSKARLPAWITWGLPVYVFASAVGNIVTTVGVRFAVDLSRMGSWSALIYAALGLGGFYGVVNNINVTYLDHGILAIQDWTRKAREIAVQAAYAKKADATGKLRRRIEEALPNIPDELLNTHLSQCCGGASVVTEIETEASNSGGDPKLYKALELADRAPRRVRSMLKQISA